MHALAWPSPDWSDLARAIAPEVERGLDRLGLRPLALPIAEGPAGLGPEGLRLPPELKGPEPHAPDDARLLQGEARALALDRWRRCAGLLLEAHVAIALGADLGWDLQRPASWPWWGAGAVGAAVDRALPHMGWLWPELASLLLEPGRGLASRPRAAAWYLRHSASSGAPHPLVGLPLPTAPPTSEEWARFGLWLRDPLRGPRASLPFPLEPAAALRPEPWSGEAWSHRPLRISGGLAGAQLRLVGPAAMAGHPIAAAGEERLLVAGQVEAGAVRPVERCPGPAGTWTLCSGSGGGRVGAARGVELTLEEDGRAELVAADAFLGQPSGEMLDLASHFGVSGSSMGSWRLLQSSPDGLAGQLSVHGLQVREATVHPRGRRGISPSFAFPAERWLGPVRSALEALDGARASWRLVEDEGRPGLIITAPLYGTTIELRFRLSGAGAPVGGCF